MNKKTQEIKGRELDYLMNNGMKFVIDTTDGSGKKEKSTMTLEIRQPTLAVLDMINHYLKDVHVDEQLLHDNSNPYPELRKLSMQHCRAVSNALAVAVLGRKTFVKCAFGYVMNRKAVREMSRTIRMNVTPSKLYEMGAALCLMCNLSDFLNSIRLMQVAPDRIEPVREA